MVRLIFVNYYELILSRVRTTTRVEPGSVLSGLNWVEPGLQASAHMYIHDV